MGTFVLSIKENGDYKYTYNNRRGKTIVTSISFKDKIDCLESIVLLKRGFETLSFPKFKTSSGKFFFRVILDGNVHCASRKFTTVLRMEKGMNDIMKYFTSGEILDFTESVFPEIQFEDEE